MQTIRGKNILVCGATGTIGSATVGLLVASGANVFIQGRNEEKLLLLAAERAIDPDRAYVGDLSQRDFVQQMAAKMHDEVPQVDILINAAGIGIIKPFEKLTVEDLQQSINSNLVSSFLLLQFFLPAMKQSKKGLIINIPGVLGKTPMAGAAAYSASKYGLVGMMQCIREEIKRTDIRITNLFLGGTDTAFWDAIDLRVQKEKMIAVDEVAKAIWFLCQQPSSGVINEMVLQPLNHQAI